MRDPNKCDHCTADDCYYGTRKCPQHKPKKSKAIQPFEYKDRKDYLQKYSQAYYQKVTKAKRKQRKVVALAGES